jgi:hypothetical protein
MVRTAQREIVNISRHSVVENACCESVDDSTATRKAKRLTAMRGRRAVIVMKGEYR